MGETRRVGFGPGGPFRKSRHTGNASEVAVPRRDRDDEVCAPMTLYSRFGKRVLDCVLVVLSLPLTAPVMGLTALVVRIDAGKPVLYMPLRTGLEGRPFRILKFRTMVVGADRIGGGTTALADPRVTRSGAWIRALKLDELPQLFNVLKGDMSLVGPRPELEQYTAQYTDAEKVILSVRPGLTDLSSVEYVSLDQHVGGAGADEVYELLVLPHKNLLRAEYARSVSFRLDCGILVRTALVLLTKAVRMRPRVGSA